MVVESGEVKAMVQGRDRRVELGHYLAHMCRKSIFYPPKNKNRCGCVQFNIHNDFFHEFPTITFLIVIGVQSYSVIRGPKLRQLKK